MKVKLANVRVAFPALFEAKTVNGEGEPRFSAVFIVEPGTENAKTLAAAVAAVAKEKWGAKTDAIMAKLKTEGRIAYHPSAKTNASGEVYSGFEGMHHVNASNKARPLVIDRDKAILNQADGRPYGGSFVNATLDLWAQDNNFGKRINASLSGVQFVRDGEAFSGGGSASPNDFDDLGMPAEEEALA